MQRVSATDARRIAELSDRLGSVRFRQLISSKDRRLVRPERLDNWRSGRGKLSDQERERLHLISSNAPLIEILAQKNNNKQSYKVNRALRDWISSGKAKGVSYNNQDAEERQKQLAAIKALRYLGIDPSDGTFYVRKRKS